MQVQHPEATDFFRPLAVERIQPRDRVLERDGTVRTVVYVRTFEPFDSIQITCRGNYHISSRKGRKLLVDDLDRFITDVPV